jgi:hypothetical protein
VSGAPGIAALAAAALKIVARDGVPAEVAANTDEAGWQALTDDGTRLDVSLAGPDIPEGIVEDIASHALIGEQRSWKGVYRLVVRAPLIVFDLCWTPGEPIRIMTFSRGDWEKDLFALAG